MYHGLVSRTVKRVEPVALIDLFLKVRALHPSTRQQFIQLCARTCFVGDVCTKGTHLRADIVAQGMVITARDWRGIGMLWHDVV